MAGQLALLQTKTDQEQVIAHNGRSCTVLMYACPKIYMLSIVHALNIHALFYVSCTLLLLSRSRLVCSPQRFISRSLLRTHPLSRQRLHHRYLSRERILVDMNAVTIPVSHMLGIVQVQFEPDTGVLGVPDGKENPRHERGSQT